MIQIQHFPTDVEWANTLKQQIDGGTLTFADAARDNSDTLEASTAGDMRLDRQGPAPPGDRGGDLRGADRQGEQPAVRSRAMACTCSSSSRSRTASPDAAQKAALESSAFSTWYSTQKDAYTIDRDPAITASGSSG